MKKYFYSSKERVLINKNKDGKVKERRKKKKERNAKPVRANKKDPD